MKQGRSSFLLALVSVLLGSALGGGFLWADRGGYVYEDGHTGKQQVGSVNPLQLVVVNGTSTATYCGTGTASRTATGTTTGTTTGTVTATQPAVTITVTGSGGGGIGTVTFVSPANTTKTSTNGGITQTNTDVATTTPAAGAIPMADTDAQISSAWIASTLSSYQATAGMTAYVQTTAIEGTGTGTSTLSSKLVHGADGRLSDARAPTGNITAAGAARLYAGTSTSSATSVDLSATPRIEVNGVTEAMQVLTDTTVGNVSTDAHGYAPKLPGDSTKALMGDGTYSVPPYANASGSSTALAWSQFFDNDLTSLADQNLLTGGDGQKTLSDGSHVYVGNSSQTGAIVYLYNGSGLRVHSHEGYGRNTATAAYWRVEDMGNTTVASGNWGMIRCSLIASMVAPTATNYGSFIGGFYAEGTGTIPSSGIITFSWPGANSRYWWSHSYSNLVSGVAKEGQLVVGYSTTSGSRSSDVGTTISGSQKDLFTFTFDRGSVVTYLGTSDSGNFPTDVLSVSNILGTGRSSTPSVYPMDIVGVYAGIFAHVGVSETQEIYVKKIRCSYK